MTIVGTHDPESLDMFDEANARAEFHIKGSAVTALILEITAFHDNSFREQLGDRWAALSPDIRGKIIDQLLTVTVNRSPRGLRRFDPQYVNIEWKRDSGD